MISVFENNKQKRKRILFPAFLLALSFSCVHNETTLGPVDTKLDRHGSLGNEYIGVNEDEEFIIQKESNVDSLLQDVRWSNEALEDEIESVHHELEECHSYLIDPRLGGNSEVFELPELDQISTETGTEEVGYNSDGNYKVVHKKIYLRHLNDERAKNTSLKKMKKVLEKTNKHCQALLVKARLDSGLPARKYKAVVRKSPTGELVIIRTAERSLDDAFRIKNSQTR